MLNDANDYTIVTAVIAMADSLGMRTTAEGVELDDQVTALQALGCDSAQGYFFGRPVPPREFARRWLGAMDALEAGDSLTPPAARP